MTTTRSESSDSSPASRAGEQTRLTRRGKVLKRRGPTGRVVRALTRTTRTRASNPTVQPLLEPSGESTLESSLESSRGRSPRTREAPADRGRWADVLGKRPRGLRRRRVAAALSWYELETAAVLTTNREAVPTVPAVVGDSRGYAGPPLGVDAETGQLISADSFGLYDIDVTQSVNVLIIGDVGTTKSSLAKCHYVCRQLVQGRRVATFDRKVSRRGGALRGEYDRVAHAAELDGYKVARLEFRPGLHGARINLMDPRITVTSGDGTQVGQDQLLRMVVELAVGRGIRPYEAHCLSMAHNAALQTAQAEGRVAVLEDVIEALFTLDAAAIPHANLQDKGVVTEQRVLEWGLEIGVALRRYVAADLAGLIDGETRSHSGGEMEMDADFLVIDTSALPEGSEQLSLVMAVMSTFIASVWGPDPRQALTIIEEGYSADLPMVGKVFYSLAKRNRGIGNALVSIFHHLDDVDARSPMRALINEVGVVHVFRQATEQNAAAVINAWSLPVTLDQLCTLRKGTHLLIEAGERRRPVRKVVGQRTPADEWIGYTDEAVSGKEPPPAYPWPHLGPEPKVI